MEFDGREGLNLAELPLPEELSYTVVNVTYEVSYKFAKGRVSYFSNGGVRVSGDPTPRIVSLIESELPRLERRANRFLP
jgi:hypothetical protein